MVEVWACKSPQSWQILSLTSVQWSVVTCSKLVQSGHCVLRPHKYSHSYIAWGWTGVETANISYIHFRDGIRDTASIWTNNIPIGVHFFNYLRIKHIGWCNIGNICIFSYLKTPKPEYLLHCTSFKKIFSLM